MKKQLKFLFGFAAASFLCGCVNFYDCASMPGDQLNDEANMPYVAQDMKVYEARKSFQKPVEIKLSEKSGRFLALHRNYSDAGKFFISQDMRKDLMVAAESKLTSIVSGLRDFKVVNMESTHRSSPGATITLVEENAPKSGNYLFTYNVLNLEIKDAGDAIGAVAGLTDMTLAVSGVRGDNTSRRLARNAQQIKWYYVDTTIEVKLTDPNGKNIFTFEKNVLFPKRFPNVRPDITLLKEAVAHAVTTAMGEYVVQFGPPLYVDETKGNGLFVRLSAGTEYGIQAGQRVRFFRKIVKKYPTLPGEPEKTVVDKLFLREGIVGIYGAPMEKDHVWVYVQDNDNPVLRSVYNWTSAEIISK